jgi:hypothetical protein
MSKIVGTLRARLGLDTKQFDKGLKGSRGRVAAFAKSVGRSMALAGAAMVAAAAVGGAALTRQSLLFIDEQAKVARTIDSTIGGLRALQLAAGDAGVGSADLNKSMQMLGARLVEAKVKGGAAGDALRRMGLDAETLLALDGDARLAAIADRIKELGLSSAEATQFLMDMGIRSKEMALLLTGGGDAIRAARQEVDDLGLSLSAVDAAKVESANDAMSRIKLVAEALGNRLAVMLAPALEAMAVGFVTVMREGGALRIFIDRITSSVASMISYLSDVAVIAGSFFEAFRGAEGVQQLMSGIGGVLRDALAPMGSVLSGLRTVIATLAGAVRITGTWGEAMALLAPVAQEVWTRIGSGMTFISASMEAASAKMSSFFLYHLGRMASKFVGFTQTVAEGLNQLLGTNLSGASAIITQELTMAYRNAEGAAISAAARADAAFVSAGRPLKSLATLQAKIKASSDAAAAGLKEATVAAHGLNTALASGGKSGGSSGGGGASGAVEKVSDGADKLKGRMDAVKESVGAAFTSLVTGAKSFKDVLGDLLGRLAEVAANSAFEALWSGVAGSVLGGGKSSGGGLLSGLFAGYFDGGGRIPSGLFGIAGEYGPEIVSGPAMVTSRANTAKMLGGGAQDLTVKVVMDQSTAALGAYVTNAAGQVLAQHRPQIIRDSVTATGRRMSQTSAFGAAQ